jgi:hypothetical protein
MIPGYNRREQEICRSLIMQSRVKMALDVIMPGRVNRLFEM